MNYSILSGRLTRDPEIRNTAGENPITVASFTVAVDRNGRDGADFISCRALGKTADTIEKYMHKGSGIELCGHIQTGSYKNKDGNTVYTTDVIVDRFEFPKGGTSKSEATQNEAEKEDSFMNIPQGIDEELPFN